MIMSRLNFKIIAALLLTVAGALGSVNPVGVDAMAGASWRTGAALETDGQYGTAGYVIFGLNVDDSTYLQPFDVTAGNAGNEYRLPPGITDITTVDTNIGMWSGNGNFGQMEDPLTNVLTSAPVLANSAGLRQYTITRGTNAAWRLTCLTASGDDQGTSITVRVDDGSGGQSLTWEHVANGLVYHVFDITAGTTPIVVTLTSAPQNRSLVGVAFDAVPVSNVPPSFVIQPAPAEVVQGGPASFNVSASGTGVSFQWQKNLVAIPGAQGATYSFLNTAADAGASYRCVATNAGGSVISDAALLTLLPPDPASPAYRATVTGETGLLAYFPFDGDIGSAVTNRQIAAQGGTLRPGAVLTGNVAEIVGTAGLRGDAGLTPETAWEFLDGKGAVEAVLYQDSNVGYNPCFFSIRSSAGVRYSLHAGGSGNILYFWNGLTLVSWPTPKNMIGRRSHIVITFEADRVDAYFDGLPLGEKTNPLGAGTNISVQIGSSTESSSEMWNGTVDEVALYNVPLSPEAVNRHASAWFGAVPSPVITSATVSGSDLILAVTTESFFTYRLETSPDLRTPWIVSGSPMLGTGDEILITVPLDGTARFYRIRVYQ